MSPADMEMAISNDPLIEHVLLIGDGCPFLSALIVLTDSAWSILEKHVNLADSDPKKLMTPPDIEQLLLDRIHLQLHDFPSISQIVKIVISLIPWTVENGLSTPTLRAKRQQILSKYTHQINTLYEGH